jgi:uncharacterized membrane protein YfcA
MKHMSAYIIVMLIVIGLAAGMLSGLVGVGGGIIIVPALVYLLAFSQKQAQGTSLAILLLPIGIFAVLNYYKDPAVHLDIKIVALITLGFLIGSYFGSKLALFLPDITVKKVFAVFMLLIAIKMLFIDKPKSNMPNEKKIVAGKLNSE